MRCLNIVHLPPRPPAMASRWRRQERCTLIADRPLPARLIALSGRAVIVEADDPGFGTDVTLSHPVAGTIAARVGARTPEGLRLHLSGDAEAAGFAMAVIAADTTQAA